MPLHNTTTVVVQGVQDGRTIGSLQWWNIAGSLYKEEEAAEKDFLLQGGAGAPP